MKTFAKYTLTNGLFCIAIILIWDAIFGDFHTWQTYLIAGLTYGIIMAASNYLSSKGWITWEKIGRMFRKNAK